MILEKLSTGGDFLHTAEGHYSYLDLKSKIFELTSKLEKLSSAKAFVVEAENGLESYVKFLSLINSGHTVFLAPSYQFKDQEFRSFLEEETKTNFIYWPRLADFSSLDIEHSGSSAHNLIKKSLERREARFIVRTSGSSGTKFKFILHDPSLFLKKYLRIGNHFKKTFAFSPAESIAGIETLLETVVHGNELVCAGDRVSPTTVADLILKYEIDYFQTTPTFLNLLMFSGEIKAEKLKSLKKIAFGSEPPQKVVLNFIRDKLPEIDLMHTYGMSEIGIQRTITCKDDPTLLILDAHYNQGRLMEDMIEVQSMTPMISYLNHSNSDSPWFKTFDHAVEENGFWRVRGRSSDLINLAGRKFFPAELEDLLMNLEGALDVIVTKEENEIVGNVVIASIAISLDRDEGEFRKSLKNFCKEHVPFYMHPQKVLLTKERQVNPRFKKIRKI